MNGRPDSFQPERALHLFLEPEQKARAKRFYIAMSAGGVFILAVASYLLYLDGTPSLATMMAIGAVVFSLLMGGFFVSYYSIGPTALVEGGVRLSIGLRRRRYFVIPYEEIEAVRVPGPFQSMRHYRVTSSDSSRFVIDGWIEHEFIERLRAQLGKRWESIFRPRKGKYPVWPPQR